MVVILGDGLLGSELERITNWDAISRKSHNFDLTDTSTFDLLLDTFDGMLQKPKYSTIVNCIANTDTYSTNKQSHWEVNYKGVAELVEFCNKWKIKLVHISSDYVYANSTGIPSEVCVPVHQETFYAYTKLLADGYIELRSNDFLVIRTTHKPSPFPYSTAWINQIGNFDYVDEIAPMIVKVVNQDIKGILNIGTPLKSMYSLALETSPKVEPILSTDKSVPTSTVMDLSKYNSIK
jgi:dTDP-4-dehydrorhamnose reductase